MHLSLALFVLVCFVGLFGFFSRFSFTFEPFVNNYDATGTGRLSVRDSDDKTKGGILDKTDNQPGLLLLLKKHTQKNEAY